jgi:hypothetical protein
MPKKRTLHRGRWARRERANHPPGSDDEWFLNQSGAGYNVGLEDADRLASAIHAYWIDWRKGSHSIVVDDAWLRQFHRREQTKKLAHLLDIVIEQSAMGAASSSAG